MDVCITYTLACIVCRRRQAGLGPACSRAPTHISNRLVSPPSPPHTRTHAHVYIYTSTARSWAGGWGSCCTGWRQTTSCRRNAPRSSARPSSPSSTPSSAAVRACVRSCVVVVVDRMCVCKWVWDEATGHPLGPSKIEPNQNSHTPTPTTHPKQARSLWPTPSTPRAPWWGSSCLR